MVGDLHDTHEFNMLPSNEQIKRLRESLLKRQKEVEQPTLRDQFAMAALQGMISYDSGAGTYEEDAACAYKWADAMLRARAAGGDDGHQ